VRQKCLAAELDARWPQASYTARTRIRVQSSQLVAELATVYDEIVAIA